MLKSAWNVLVRLLGVARRLTVLLVILLMLAFNIASFAFAQIGDVLSSVAEATFKKSWVTNLADQNRELRRRKTNLEEGNARLSKHVDNLEADKVRLQSRVEELDVRNGRLSKKVDDFDGVIRRQADEVASAKILRRNFDDVGAGISRRIASGAARNIASIPLESVPVLGIMTIAVVTGVEVVDACTTFKELQDLRRLAGIEPLENLMDDTCKYVPFTGGGALELSKIPVDKCFAQAVALKQLDVPAGEELRKTCACIERSPGFEEQCFPEGISVNEATINLPEVR